VHNSQPWRIGTHADWQELVIGRSDGYIRKTDGSAWEIRLQGKERMVELWRQTNWDQIVPETFSEISDQQMAYVGKDGTLWASLRLANDDGTWWPATGFVQIGHETRWAAVAMSRSWMLALKQDGTLWQWDLTAARSADEVAGHPPTRLGIHSDWVALTGDWLGAVSVAADGSVWYWQDRCLEAATLLKLPKQPVRLGNVLAEE